jgi:hypothetical protein
VRPLADTNPTSAITKAGMSSTASRRAFIPPPLARVSSAGGQGQGRTVLSREAD